MGGIIGSVNWSGATAYRQPNGAIYCCGVILTPQCVFIVPNATMTYETTDALELDPLCGSFEVPLEEIQPHHDKIVQFPAVWDLASVQRYLSFVSTYPKHVKGLTFRNDTHFGKVCASSQAFTFTSAPIPEDVPEITQVTRTDNGVAIMSIAGFGPMAIQLPEGF